MTRHYTNINNFREQTEACGYCRFFIREQWKDRRLVWGCKKSNTPDVWMDFEDHPPDCYVCDDWGRYPDESED